MKPLLADNWDENKIVFPIYGQPKIDGVRGLNLDGNFTGRSLKSFKNRYLTKRYSQKALLGFDGEIAAVSEKHPDLCRITSSATGTIEGEPDILWWLFDYITPDIVHNKVKYSDRYNELICQYNNINITHPELSRNLRIMPTKLIENMQQLLAYDEDNLAAGYEGTILRDPNAPYKEGRSGKKPILWRIKRFTDFEFKVHTIIEGNHNTNETQLNELGNTFRSTHQDNMVGNGLIGAMIGNTLNVVKDEQGKLLFDAGQEVKVGAGCLTAKQRKYYFNNQNEFKSQIHKGKFFAKGIKDKLRFPNWQSFRNYEDMSKD